MFENPQRIESLRLDGWEFDLQTAEIRAWHPDGRRVVRLTPGKRVLFLTKDLELIRRQLRGELTLSMKDVRPEDLLDDINTDVMTPAWVCFRHRPADIALDAYAGLVDEAGERNVGERGGEVHDGGGASGIGSRRRSGRFANAATKLFRRMGSGGGDVAGVADRRGGEVEVRGAVDPMVL